MSWSMPSEFPDLSGAKALAVDIETRDDDLKSQGPGVRRGSYVVGVALSTSDGEFSEYYPVAHDEGPNLNGEAVMGWLRQELGRSQPKVGANLLYDFDFLEEAGVVAGGKWLDVQNAEPLIDEDSEGGYGLDDLAKKYLGKAKLLGSLSQEMIERGLKGNPRASIWRLPASVVGPYAIEDARLSMEVLKKQLPILKSEKVHEVFKMETALMPLLLRMRRGGVRIDSKKLNKVVDEFKSRKKRAEEAMSDLAGFEVQVWAAASVQAAFEAAGVEYPKTPKTGKPSFTKDFMKSHEHPLPRAIEECRTLDKFITTFLVGGMQEKVIDGRIHCMFNQLKGDEYGTVSGRFSSSHPNLQNVPVKDPELGPLCRSMFVPEEGCLWGRADYSQIEFRLFAHFSRGPGSEEFQERYRSDPKTDYHQWCADKAGITRKRAKHINFGLIYGMGIALLAESLSLSLDEAREFVKDYTDKMPFMRATQRTATETASTKGFVRTVMGRRRRFQEWEPTDRRLSGRIKRSRDKAEVVSLIRQAALDDKKDYSSGVQRHGTYKALNAVVQGSAADIMKKSMVDCWKDGVFDVLTPHLTIHDELDVSVPDSKEGREAFSRMLELMEGAVELKVPLTVEATLGRWWGDADERSQFDKKSEKKK